MAATIGDFLFSNRIEITQGISDKLWANSNEFYHHWKERFLDEGHTWKKADKKLWRYFFKREKVTHVYIFTVVLNRSSF
jgi:hypothetical protein